MARKPGSPTKLKTMKKTTILIFLAFASLSLWAQFPGAGAPPNAKAGQSMNMGRIYGKVTDSAGKAIADASVIVLQKKFDSTTKKSKEVLVKGMNY